MKAADNSRRNQKSTCLGGTRRHREKEKKEHKHTNNIAELDSILEGIEARQ